MMNELFSFLQGMVAGALAIVIWAINASKKGDDDKDDTPD